MKKLSILLIGLLLVSGFAVAQEFDGGVAVTGEASVTFGVDLNTNATGFANAATSTLTITLVSEQTVSNGGDDGLYGWIQIADLSLTATPAGTGGSVGAVTAMIVVDPAEIKIYSAPGFAIDKTGTLEATNEVDVNTAITNINGSSINGITVTVPVDPITLALKFASDGDWTENVDNEYVIGTDLTVNVSPITLSVAFTYGWLTTAPVLGVGVKADVALDVVEGLDAYVAMDGNMPEGGDFAYDTAFGVALGLSPADDDGNQTTFAVDAFFAPYGGASTDSDLDVEIAFSEHETAGFVDMMSATVAVELFDLLVDPMTWNVDVDGAYNTGDLMPYFGFGYGDDEIFDLNVGVELYAGMTGIDNTTIVLDYDSTDIETDNGIITAKATVTY